MSRLRRTALIATAALCAGLLAPLGSTGASAATIPLTPANGKYDVTITRTEHGIPHVVAKDWESLGFGHGFATGETSICSLADTLLTGQGQRSRWLGPDARYNDRVSVNATNLQSDAFFVDIRARKVVEKLLADPQRGPGKEARALVRGYSAGVNQYIKSVGGRSGIKDPACKNAGYIDTTATDLDLWYGVYAANLLASAGVFFPAIADADPPSVGDLGIPKLKELGIELPLGVDIPDLPDLPIPDLSDLLPFSAPPTDAPSASSLKAGLGKDPKSPFGSNATALGGDSTDNGRGMLLGNPHFPWNGRYRFEQVHLTIPGAYDAAGASLLGSPVINIGFNKNVAWSHTVSTAFRFTPYEYRTIPGLPMLYLTDHGLLKLEKRAVNVTVKGKDGKLSNVVKTLYRTEDGYVMDNPATLMGWSPISLFAMRDANGEQLRTIDSFLNMSKASNVQGLLAAQDKAGGIPWVNTIAADRAGNALYADHSVVPNVPNDLVNQCITPVGILTRSLAGLPVLDGTRARSSCAWRTDPDASRPGIFGPKNLPSTVRRDWVANANDSYWLPNPKQRLEGYAGIIGSEKSERTLRTRMVYRYVIDALTKSKITQTMLRGFEHQNRVFGVELARENGDLDTLCQSAGGGQACDVLKAWDGKSNTTSVGAHIFEEFMARASDPWAVPFDAADPMGTPRDLKETDSKTIKAMADAIAYLQGKGVALDAPWGTLQIADKPGAAIGLGGGGAAVGNANVVVARGPFTRTDGLYRVTYGSSHIQAVSFTASGIVASTILTYGQSLNTNSAWSSDQTRMFGKKQWVSFPFTASQISSQKISSKHLVVKR
ncbi:acyl-homoserine-lactone acylase [Aeromicrobium panaciterrae]|uniref:Acyl-homoserine-lactone acylase n=1 Tax=Aeromicrobium panaciterrae TaxID=363861 RepID=A0ABU1UNZ5_9ACTN|nr:penicillin acylase family protein [Aeromicrobium panaciterrae]MDR7086898.1 acyl-homoserine-lactone acylase [Aeromicrobium panaciterrae]